jgi:hypothetical protein
MTQDEIIEMAKQAHLGVTLTHDGEIGQFIEGANWTEELVAFAKLVAAKEREACAKVCIERGLNYKNGAREYFCADAIRNRGEA